MNQQLCKFSESKNYSLYKKNLVRNKFFIKKKKLETNLIDKNSIRSIVSSYYASYIYTSLKRRNKENVFCFTKDSFQQNIFSFGSRAYRVENALQPGIRFGTSQTIISYQYLLLIC